MKTKKTVIAVLAAVLLISAALIVGCIDQIDATGISGKNAEDNYIIPEGKGVVRIKFVDSNAKTILPSTSLGSYTYDLLITRNGGSTTEVNVLGKAQSYFLSGGDGYAISLPPDDDYKISLTAKSGGVPVGGWDNGGETFEIEEGEPTGLDAELTPFQDGQGTFAYSVTKASNGTTTFDILDSDGDSIENTYYGYSHGDTAEFPMDVSGNEADTITLDSGFYTVIITASLADHQTVQYIHALHIYDGLTSSLTQDLSAITLAQDRFTVTYDFSHSVKAETSAVYTVNNPETNVIYASHLTQRNGLTFADGYTIGGFYKTYSSTFGNKWNFNTDRVTDDITLYVEAVAPGDPGSLAITITFPMDDIAVTAPASINKNDVMSGATPLVITAPANLTGIHWYSAFDGGTEELLNYIDFAGEHDRLIFNATSENKYLSGDILVVNLEGDGGYSKSVGITLTVVGP